MLFSDFYQEIDRIDVVKLNNFKKHFKQKNYKFFSGRIGVLRTFPKVY